MRQTYTSILVSVFVHLPFAKSDSDDSEAANAAARTKGTYLRDKFYRLKARRGYKRAAVARAYKILVSIYHMFSPQVSYNDLGDLYLAKLNKNHLTRHLVHRLERFGYSVTLTAQQIVA